MSEPAHIDIQRSSIEISVSAYGAHQWRVRVYAMDDSDDALHSAVALAKSVDRKLENYYGLPSRRADK